MTKPGKQNSESTDVEAASTESAETTADGKSSPVAKPEPEQQSPTTRKRRPWTTLLVLAGSVLGGLFGYYLNSCFVQLNAISKLANQGAEFTYEPSPYSEWLTSVLPQRVVDRVVEVRIADSDIVDISPVAKFRHLRKLWIVSTKVYDIRSLSRCWELEELVLDFSPVRDLSPLQTLDKLKILRFSDTKVRNLDPLASLNLNAIFFAGTSVRQLDALHDMQSLEMMACGRTPIRSLEPLGQLDSLLAINMDDAYINDLRPLEKMKKLNSVSFKGLPLVPSQVARLDLFLPEWECKAFVNRPGEVPVRSR